MRQRRYWKKSVAIGCYLKRHSIIILKKPKKTYNNELQEQKRELEAIRLTEVKKSGSKKA
jgi:hypothetical protein